MRIHHVAVTVSDIEISKSWYTKIFDLSLVAQYEKGNRIFCLLEKDGDHIELIQPLSDTTPLPEYRKNLDTDLLTGGTKHVCFLSENIQESLKYMQSNGVTVATAVKSAGFGGNYFFITDPDGNFIEIWSAD